MFKFLAQTVSVVAGLLGGYFVTRVVDFQEQVTGVSSTYVIFLFIMLGGAMGFVLGGIIGRELTTAWKRVHAELTALSIVDLILGTAGLVIGLVISFLCSQPFRLLASPVVAAWAMVLLSTVCAYIGVSVAMPRRREFAVMFPRLAPEALRAEDERSIVLDTSAVIDGRFRDLRKAGFLQGKPKVPRFVLAELQTLADSADEGKRSRGRRGLDLLASLPEASAVEILEIDYPELVAVDDKLMQFAADTETTMVTVDYNLTKVARVRGISVLNLNEAAESLRPNMLPGDELCLKVVKPGKEAGQGVGYLEDGTMVVIQDGRPLVGSDAEIEVMSVLQTSAGRMVFARPLATG